MTERSDLKLLEEQPELRVLTINSALREPIIDRTLPLLGKVTWPKPEPDFEAIRNMSKRNSNMAGVAILQGRELDMVPRLVIDGVEHPLICDNSYNAHLVALPMVFGDKPKKATLFYGDREPIQLQLPASGRPTPWNGDKVIDLGELKVHLVVPVLSVPTRLIQARVFVEGGKPGQVYRVSDPSGAVLVTNKPVSFPIYLGDNRAQRLQVSPVTQSQIELKAVFMPVPGGRNFKLGSDDGTTWFEAEKSAGQSWFKGLPRPDGSVVQVVGTRFGVYPPELESPKTSPTLLEMWKVVEKVKNGQKFNAILYKPEKVIASGTIDLAFLDALKR